MRGAVLATVCGGMLAWGWGERVAGATSAEAPFARSAAERFDASVRAELGYTAGEMLEGLRYTEMSGDTDVRVRSRLDWPENAVVAGGTVSLTLPAFRIGLGFLTNLTGEPGKIEDSDWVGSRALNVPDTKFSYTASDVHKRRIVRFQLSVALPLLPEHGLELQFGYRHHYYYGRAVGLDGWQLDEDGNRRSVHLGSDFVGGTVTTQQALPYIGLGWVPIAQRFTLRTAGRLQGLYHRSVDDHSYRNKVGTASGAGLGLGFVITPSVALSPRVRLGIAFGADFAWLLGGTLRQRFYADDPGTPGTEGPDTSIPDSNAEHRSYHFSSVSFVEFAP